jgi:hypothetical protein
MEKYVLNTTPTATNIYKFCSDSKCCSSLLRLLYSLVLGLEMRREKYENVCIRKLVQIKRGDGGYKSI